MPDHVHILTQLAQNRALADMMRDLKANSSRWVHETFPERRDFGWHDGYAAFTVSVKGVPKVKDYIARQEEHHRVTSYREELKSFLEAHDIPFDERYL